MELYGMDSNAREEDIDWLEAARDRGLLRSKSILEES